MKNSNHMSKPTLEPTAEWINDLVGFHSIPAGAGFDDGGKLVPIVWQDNEREQFEDAMADLELSYEQSARAARLHEQYFLAGVNQRAGECFKVILLRLAKTKLSNSPEYAALVALFDTSKTLEQHAAEAGKTKQAFNFHVQKMRSILAEFLPSGH
jgi:hypothetical protein